jgi:uncharacterized membrane protein
MFGFWGLFAPAREIAMRETRISLPELILIAGTRAALGAGIGLLLADRLSQEERRAIGWTLFFVGALTTIPLGFEVFGGGRLSASTQWQEQTTGPRSDINERFGQRESLART